MRSMRDHEIQRWGAIEQGDGSYINYFGTILWYNESGELHREDGPAMIHPMIHPYDTASCSKNWWLNSKEYPFDDWLIKLNKTDEDKMLLRLQYA